MNEHKRKKKNKEKCGKKWKKNRTINSWKVFDHLVWRSGLNNVHPRELCSGTVHAVVQTAGSQFRCINWLWHIENMHFAFTWYFSAFVWIGWATAYIALLNIHSTIGSSAVGSNLFDQVRDIVSVLWAAPEQQHCIRVSVRTHTNTGGNHSSVFLL